jgi:hypothetical protein
MTHDEARQIIREHYRAVATTGDMARLRQAVAYLSDTLAEHMAWDSAVALAEWIKGRAQQDSTPSGALGVAKRS